MDSQIFGNNFFLNQIIKWKFTVSGLPNVLLGKKKKNYHMVLTTTKSNSRQFYVPNRLEFYHKYVGYLMNSLECD